MIFMLFLNLSDLASGFLYDHVDGVSSGWAGPDWRSYFLTVQSCARFLGV